MSHILVIDDEKTIRFGFKRILTGEGYEVTTAENYDAVLEIFSRIEPDLIFSDILLGTHTGIDVLSEVKKKKMLCPVILITGKPSLETSAEALRLGAFDYIPKPIRKETLLRLTRHGLRHKQLEDKRRQLELDNLEVRKNMEAIFSSLKEGIITVDQNRQVTQLNPAAVNMCGLQLGDWIGNDPEKGNHFCTSACINVLKEALTKQKPTKEYKIECRHHDRPEQVVVLTGTPLQPSGGKCSGVVLVLRDITERLSLERELQEKYRFHRIIGKSDKMQEVFGLIKNISESDSTALIIGETGTGKELAAHAIHHSSHRKDKPFVKVNCSALSEGLLESELFGHVKGAFTGAIDNKDGRFEIAHQGTLFLDELGDISPLIQLKLLRVLQEKEFERVGDSTPIKSDVRILAATNCDLKEKVKQGEFREDLFYRIKVVTIDLPPLRKRREDIPLLSRHFLELFNQRFKKKIQGFSNEITDAFMSYPWPGNIRELEHAVEHGFVICRSDMMLFKHLPAEIKEYFQSQKKRSPTKKDLKKQDIFNALNKTGWNKSKAARILGIARRTIYYKIEEFNIVKPSE